MDDEDGDAADLEKKTDLSKQFLKQSNVIRGIFILIQQICTSNPETCIDVFTNKCDLTPLLLKGLL